MNWFRKLIPAVLSCAGIVMVVLVTAVLVAHLTANRELVKSYIVNAANRVTGGTLEYGPLEIRFFPIPHLTAQNIYLRRPDAFALQVSQLSIYPRFLPMLKGHVSIRHLNLASPVLTVPASQQSLFLSDPVEDNKSSTPADDIKKGIQAFFNRLEMINSLSELKIVSGTIILARSDGENLTITNMNAFVEKDEEDLSFHLNCRSDVSGEISVRISANIPAMRATGKATLSGINVRPLLSSAMLPKGISTKDTRAKVHTTFTLDGPENIHGRFNFHFPSLTILRKNRSLDMEAVALSGTIGIAPKDLTISFDNITSKQPALDLSADAIFTFEDDDNSPVVELRARAKKLDVAIASAVTSAIAGDLDAIQTAFSVARQGKLTDVSFFAGFKQLKKKTQLVKLKASGHLTKGLVTISGILADLEELDGDVVYEDNHVAFKHVSGYFKGATFQKLDAAIDWQKQPTLSIKSSSVKVDMEVFYSWLTSLEGVAEAKNYMDSIAGTGKLSSLTIAGPLVKPQNWIFKIVGSPEKVLVKSPLIPFGVTFSGGEITFVPDRKQAVGVKVDFLDGSVISSYQSKKIINPESTSWHINGTIGQSTLDWLNTILPIPEHLQIQPPVELSNVHILTNDTHTFSFSGKIKTAGGVNLYADFFRSPDAWQIRKIQFSDGHSNATVAVTKVNSILDLSFSGNIEKQTANRLLRENRTLLGYLKGNFHALIDTHEPLKSSFNGKLEGKSLQIHELLPEAFSIDKFFVEGNGKQLTIGPSRICVMNSKMGVQGVITRAFQRMTFDVDVIADVIDEALISALQSIGKENSDSDKKQGPQPEVLLAGTIHLNTTDFSYGGFTWTPVKADINVENNRLSIQIDKANLCGISTIGKLTFSHKGISMRLSPTASNASLQTTVDCLWDELYVVDTHYDLSGEINLPFTKKDPALFLYGQMELTSENGRILYSNVLMKILTILNVTELFTGGYTDLKKKGLGYSKAYVKVRLGGGKLVFEEIFLDGYSLKLTGNGSMDLTDREVNIELLAAPLKTVDSIIKRLPVIGYITGGALVTIPFLVEGPIENLTVVPLPPSKVGKGLIGLMERTLKAPFKLVESVSEIMPKDFHNGRLSQESDTSGNEP